MKRDTLQSIASFLSPIWSNCNEVRTIVGDYQCPCTSRATVMLPEKIMIRGLTEFDKYRLWRFGLWHEDQHVKMNAATGYLNDITAWPRPIIRNILDDRYIELKGIQTWKGMEAERTFAYELLYNLSTQLEDSKYVDVSNPNALEAYRKIRVFMDEFAHDKIRPVNLPSATINLAKEAAVWAKNEIDGLVADDHETGHHTWFRIQDIISEVVSRLQISTPKLAIDSMIRVSGCEILDSSLASKVKVDSKQVKVDLSEKLKEKGIGMQQIQEILHGSMEAKAEFNQIRIEERKLKASERSMDGGLESSKEKSVTSSIKIPRRINLGSAEVRNLVITAINDGIINQMKNRLRRWRIHWVEKLNASGDEFDVESYIDNSAKPFFNEVRLKAPRKAVILLDHSGSIAEFKHQYQVGAVALCEALKTMDVKFVVLAFNQFKPTKELGFIDNVWLIKGPNEEWGRKQIARMVCVKALSHTTPLGKILGLTYNTVSHFKPEVFITLTDGAVDDANETRHMVKEYQKLGVRMLGVGIASDAVTVAALLRCVSFDGSLAVSNIRELPNRIIDVLTERD